MAKTKYLKLKTKHLTKKKQRRMRYSGGASSIFSRITKPIVTTGTSTTNSKEKKEMVFQKFIGLTNEDTKTVMQKVIGRVEEYRMKRKNNIDDRTDESDISAIEDIADIYVKNLNNSGVRKILLRVLVESSIMFPYMEEQSKEQL
jgi:hypothetical protein